MSLSEAGSGAGSKAARAWLLPKQVPRLHRYAGKGAYSDVNRRDRALITLLYDSGLRVGEAVALDVDNFNLEASTPEVYLPSSIQKGENPPPAYLDLAESTAAELEAYFSGRPGGSVGAAFPSRQGPRAHANSLRRAVRKAAIRAGVRPYLGGVGSQGVSRGSPEQVTPHVLRHSVAYRMIRGEEKRMVDVQLRLRHADLRTTAQIYGHLRRR